MGTVFQKVHGDFPRYGGKQDSGSQIRSGDPSHICKQRISGSERYFSCGISSLERGSGRKVFPVPLRIDLEGQALRRCGTFPDGNGDGDATNEIGYTNSAASNLLSGDLRNILRPFGTMVSRADNYMGIDGDGNAVFMPIQENYKEAVQWMHGLWEKGILDPEYFTQDASMVTSKIQADGGSQVGLITGWVADAVAGANADQFVLLEALEGPDGNRYVENASNVANKNKENGGYD